MKTASARHILVDDEPTCVVLKQWLEDGRDFGELAKAHSKCPTGPKGGDLGQFMQGQMVPEFDEVVFSGELGKILGPVHTQFGYHLIEITARSD